MVLGTTVWLTGSINKSFCVRKGMPSITSCDVSGATLRIVGDLIAALTGGRNRSLVESSLEIRTGLFESALCKREGDKVGRGRRLLGFRSISFLDMKSEVEPQSTNPCAWTWSSSWIGRMMAGTTWQS